MSISDIQLFNYYHRYPWSALDFEKLETSLVDSIRGSFQGAYGGAVLSGLVCLRSTGRTVSVSSGIAVAPDGMLLHLAAETLAAFQAPTGGKERALIVLRPLIEEVTPITSPVDPAVTLMLNQRQGCEVVMIRGTPSASPVYPAKLPNDVVLCGVFLDQSNNLDGNTDIDYEIRDIPGKNSKGQMDFGRWDDRLRPFRHNASSLGIKPSILGPNVGSPTARPSPVGYTYISSAYPSRFPRNMSGNFENADTYVDFATGFISGADGHSAPFTPRIPEAGKYIPGVLQIDADDKILVSYAYNGTFSYTSKTACFTDFMNLGFAFPRNAKSIAYFCLYSSDGITVSDIDFLDLRSPGNVVSKGNSEIVPINFASGTVAVGADQDGKILAVDYSTQADGASIVLATLPGNLKNFRLTIKDVGGNFSRLNVSVNVANAGTMKIEGATTKLLEADFGSWTFNADNVLGANYWLI